VLPTAERFYYAAFGGSNPLGASRPWFQVLFFGGGTSAMGSVYRPAMVRSLTAVITVALAIAGSSAARESPRGVVANCAMQSGASFPGAFTSSRNLVVGPLVMIGARGTPTFSSSFHGQKFPLLLKEGHRVTLELSLATRRGAALGYGPLPQGDVGVAEAHGVVTFIACRRGASDSEADGKPVTFWSGGVLVKSPRCVPLRVWVDGAPSPRRVVIRLGVERCR
jgi:hypothetical protein